MLFDVFIVKWFGFPRERKLRIDMALKSLIIFPKPLPMTAAHVLKERINNNNKKSRRQIESDLTKSRSLLTLQMRLHLPTYLR